MRIFKTYGADAVEVMSKNPYRLARDIRGIGFRTADLIAEKLGIEKTAMTRLPAGTLSPGATPSGVGGACEQHAPAGAAIHPFSGGSLPVFP